MYFCAMVNKQEVQTAYEQLQDRICKGLEQIDGKASFVQDLWQRPEGGGGKTRIMQEGKIIEKGGVNFSAVWGDLNPKIAKALGLANNSQFFATGVSIVLHPHSPLMPIIHMNVRYFEINDNTYWFGGGIDLTPHYVTPADAAFFHHQLKTTCDAYDAGFYPRFKKWADDYFFIKHRNETRGIGGIFYDRLSEHNSLPKNELLAFSLAVGNSFVPIYRWFANKYAQQSFTQAHKNWQMLRRSRYVEFNLVYDKGTKFGLDTNGRIESILMSMPPQAKWVYNYQATPNSPEAQTLALLKKDIDWLTVKNPKV